MTALKPAAAYARFSSDLSDERSIDDQKLLCEKLARQHGYEIIQFYSDRAKWGATMDERHGVLTLLNDVKKGSYQAVFAEALDRLARDPEDIQYIFKRMNFYDTKIITLNGINSEVHVGVSGIVDSMFRKNLGDKVRRGWDGRVQQGLTPGSPAYGYRTVPDKPCERELDPETSEVVRRIFSEYADERPLRQIAADLNRDGIPPPMGGAAWNHQTFIAGSGNGKGIIGNRIYIGELIWNSHRTAIHPDTKKRVKRKGNPEDLLTVQIPHLRIIGQDLWDRAQRLRTARSRQISGPRVTQKTKDRHMLAGRLCCGACGGMMKVVWSQAGQNPRVGCGNARDRAICSNSKSYDLIQIEATVLQGIKLNLDVDALMSFTKGAHEEWAARRKAAGRDRDEIERALTRATAQVDRIVSAISDSDAPIKPLMDKLKKLELERAGLAEKLRQSEGDGNVIILHPEAITRFRKNLETLHGALTDTKLDDAAMAPFRIAFGNVFDRVVVHVTGKRRPVEVTPYARLSAIMGVDFFPKMRTPEEVLGKEGLANKFLATETTLSYQKLNIIGLGRWMQAA